VALAAVTVKVDALPAVIEVGLALMVTVGASDAATVTVVFADVFPPGPDAIAVYITVALGLTACVPPFGCNEYEEPSEPLIVTCVAFVAVTVKADELPAEIEVGLALMPTIGAVGGFIPLSKMPQPASVTKIK